MIQDNPRQGRSLLSITGRALPVIVGLALVGTLAAGCSNNRDPFAGTGSPHYQGSGPVPWGGGVRKVGNPYDIAGITYYPREDRSYDSVGTASWYGPKFDRRQTANGEWFDQTRLTAAHPTLHLPVYARVTNLENNRTVVVRINDRGPFAHDREIDLSRAAAEELGFRRAGTAQVRVQYLAEAPIHDDGGRHLVAMNEQYRGGGAPDTRLAAAPITTVAESARSAEPQPGNAGPETHEPMRTNFSRAATMSSEPLTTASVPSPSAPTASGSYYVQAAAFSNKNKALALRQRLSTIGNVEVAELNSGSGPLYRVRVGPLHDSAAANQALQRVVQAGHGDARIVSTN